MNHPSQLAESKKDTKKITSQIRNEKKWIWFSALPLTFKDIT